MKIEMCESLFYSWLRHVKGCQLVQTNWKPSPVWTVENRERVEELMRETDIYFRHKRKYDIFKGCSLSVMISQTKSTLVGMTFDNEHTKVYSIETAFLNDEPNCNKYDTSEIIKKWIFSALSIVACFNTGKGEIIFESPIINNEILNDLNDCAADMNKLLSKNGFDFRFRVIGRF